MNAKSLFCLLLPVIFLVAPSHAASVRMLTGESYHGKADLNAGCITISPDGAAPVKIDTAGIQDAVFDTAPTYQQGTIPSGVLLVNGSFIAGRLNPDKYEAPTLVLGDAKITFPSSAIAQVQFLGLDDPSKLRPAAGGGTGAMLNDGDFLAGTVDGMKEGRLQVNNAVLGPQRLTPGNQISGWVLRDAQPGAAAYQVVTRDGSRFLTNDLKFDPTGVSFTDSIAGPVTVKMGDLSEIRAGSGRYQALTDATPVRIDPPPGMAAAAAYKLQPADPYAPDSAPAILTAANALVYYSLPPGFGVLAASVAVSKDSPATAQIAFDVYADGRLIFGSPIVNAGANPQAIRVNLGSARLITLRAEPEGPGSSGATGRWTAPVLLRQ